MNNISDVIMSRDDELAGEVKTLLRQLLRGVQHLHDNWIIHRDLKASNLLLSHKGILKVSLFIVSIWFLSRGIINSTQLLSSDWKNVLLYQHVDPHLSPTDTKIGSD